MNVVIDKVKSKFDVWRLEKYTKRRSFLPEFESRDKQYYKDTYHDGIYDNLQEYPVTTSSNQGVVNKLNRAQSRLSKRASTLLGRSSSGPLPRCSETYNKRPSY